ncbi:hypothetical protein [Oceanobacillus alkalisoli]|nr:hypothetical protein [Oceanobacillus alkalisoli]
MAKDTCEVTCINEEKVTRDRLANPLDCDSFRYGSNYFGSVE